MEVILEAEGITRYFDGFCALYDVSFDLKRGEIVGLIGPNGAGKTTLLNIISGIFPPTKGRILFKGLELRGLKPHTVCRLGISRVLQTPRPFVNMTVLENVVVGATFGRASRADEPPIERAEAILRFMELHPKADLPVKSLNLQEKKMVDMARALASGPEVLLLDEVMSGLTPAEVEGCMALIKRIRDELGVTILWVEHVMKAVMRLAERVIVLHHGQVITTGSPARVAQDQRVIDAYLGGAKLDDQTGGDRDLLR